jgi:hypothetical protein
MISKKLKSNHWYGVSKNSSNSSVLLQVSNFDFYKEMLPGDDQVRIRLTPDEARKLAILLNKYADEIDTQI